MTPRESGTYCGVFRRQALDRGAHILTVDHIVTGHNADDVAETVLMNGALLSLSFILVGTRLTDSFSSPSFLPFFANSTLRLSLPLYVNLQSSEAISHDSNDVQRLRQEGTSILYRRTTLLPLIPLTWNRIFLARSSDRNLSNTLTRRRLSCMLISR